MRYLYDVFDHFSNKNYLYPQKKNYSMYKIFYLLCDIFLFLVFMTPEVEITEASQAVSVFSTVK